MVFFTTDTVMNVTQAELERVLGALRVLELIGDKEMTSRMCLVSPICDILI